MIKHVERRLLRRRSDDRTDVPQQSKSDDDDHHRWSDEGGWHPNTRNMASTRQDLYESDFTDLEQMRRDVDGD